MNEHEEHDAPGYGVSIVSVDAARAWVDGAGSPLSAFVDGECRPALDEDAPDFVATSITGLALRVSVSAADRVSAALTTASHRQHDWHAAGARARAEVLASCATTVHDHADLIGVVSAVSAPRAIRTVLATDLPHTVWALRHASNRARMSDPGSPVHRPRGVCLVIDDGKRSRARVVLHVAAALATGNTVVWATDPRATAGALAIADLCSGAGLPAGVVNVVTAHASELAALAASDDVAVVTCLADDSVVAAAARLANDAGKHMVRIVERPVATVVLADADVDSAVEALAETVASRVGCSASPTRLLLEEARAEDVMRRFGRRLARLRVGDCLDASVDIVDTTDGAPASAAAVERTVAEGSRLVGRSGDDGTPTHVAALLTDVAPASAPHLDQVDGGVVVADTFRTANEAASMLSASGSGTLSVWCEEVGPVLDLVRRAHASTAFVNAGPFDHPVGSGPHALLGDLHPDPTWSYLRCHCHGLDASDPHGAADDDLKPLWHAWRARAAETAGSARDVRDAGLVVALPTAVGTIGIVSADDVPAVTIAHLVFGALAAGNQVTLAVGAAQRGAVEEIERVLKAEGGPSRALAVAPAPPRGDTDRDLTAAARALADGVNADAVWIARSGTSRHGYASTAAGRLVPLWHACLVVSGDRSPSFRAAAASAHAHREIWRHASAWKVIVL